MPKRNQPPPAGNVRSPGGGKPRAPKAAPRKKAPQRAAAPAAGPRVGSPPERSPVVPVAPEPPFPVVGIGASAGGLEALEAFLQSVPAKSGMAFVVIQHLDPTHKGAMVELLQRSSPMKVVEVVDRQAVEPDCVYVIPPGKDISILHGLLHLLPMTSPRGLNLPIDYFFRSLAEDRQEAGIGVVLSGMGSDGTLGLRAIKEKAGATFVQALTDAKFDGMPRSAIEAGLADVVAPARELPGRIIAYHQHALYVPRAEPKEPEARQQSALEKVLILLRTQCGNDFSLYKRSTVERRIERRMGLHQMDKMGDYVRYLRENPRETELLFKELLIGVTSFFRDPEAWEYLRKEVLPELLRSRGQGGVLRAWVPACSTGEEAYSLAMILSEAIDALQPVRNLAFQIFATDLDKEAIEKARQALYPANVAADVSPERLRRFFVQDNAGYRVRKEIREAVIFAPQNLITDPPFTKLDILSCRNLLIYLSGELQKKLIPLFHYSLNPGGVLFLGSAETIGGFANLFGGLDGKARLYRRLERAVGAPPVEFPSAFVKREGTLVAREGEGLEPPRAAAPNLQTLTDRLIVQRFSPAAILTNEKGDILYLSARTGKYLEPAVGRANLNLFAMAREGLRLELSTAFASALAADRPVVVHGVRVRTNGSSQLVDLTVQKLVEPKELRGAVITVVADVAESPEAPPAAGRPRTPASRRLVELELELQRAREEAQTTREEMQTSQEELKSTNEELQSTNEELQSTNEELTTSKEEMQSMNEELQTVNQELQSKIDDLARSNNDMRNLLNSTDLATLFLDGELLVRRFTTPTSRIFKLIPSDTGRPFTDIATELDYPTMADDAREVLRTLMFKEIQAPSKGGRWYSVRIMPYRTLENVIDGVVITFADVTSAKELEITLRDQASQLSQMAESLPDIVWGCRPDGSCDYLSRRWAEYTGMEEKTQLGYGWLDQLHPDDRARVGDAWQRAVREKQPFAAELRLRAKNGGFRWFRTRSVPISDEHGTVVKWYGTHADVDDLKRSEQEIADRLAHIREWSQDAALVLDEKLAIARVNPAAVRWLGRPREALLGKPLAEIAPEAARSAFAGRIREVLRDGADTTFEIAFADPPLAGAYTVLALRSQEGVTALLRPGRSPES